MPKFNVFIHTTSGPRIETVEAADPDAAKRVVKSRHGHIIITKVKLVRS